MKAGVWQNRFKKRIAREVLAFSSSIKDDERLVPYDIIASLVHVEMLAKQGIVTYQESKKIKGGLRRLFKEYSRGRFKMQVGYEDVHMNIEHRLEQLIGNSAFALHTARSRNDLIATDLKLYTRDEIMEIMKRTSGLQKTIIKKAREYLHIVWPGYTHLQQAQPLLFSFYLLSHFYKFQRSFECLKDMSKRINISPLGSCALAGTSFRTDLFFSARRLKFERFFDNALDAVANRDFLCEAIFHLAQIMIHLSSLAEDLIIFSTSEFNMVELDDTIATGSSIMPHKKNPDICELIRAKAAKAIGNLTAAIAILKGLPSSYNRDLQELKGILFRQIDETIESLNISEVIIRTLKVKPPHDKSETLIATTDLVDYLVKKGNRFRAAYDLIVACVRDADGNIAQFVKICAHRTKLDPEKISYLLKPKSSIAAKASAGSTSLRETKKSIIKASRLIHANQTYLRSISKKFRLQF